MNQPAFHNPPDHVAKRPVTYLYERRVEIDGANIWSHCWVTFFEYDIASVMPLTNDDFEHAGNKGLPLIVLTATSDIVNAPENFRLLDHEVVNLALLTDSHRKEQRQIDLR